MKNPFFTCPYPGVKPPRKGPPPSACYDGGYIVEKIVNRQTESLCYDGLLTLDGLPAGLCTPLRLCDAQVTQIRPCGNPQCVCDAQPLILTLLCTVMDARGCRAGCCASIELKSCAKIDDCAAAFLNLRRGAEICVGCAHFYPPCGFHVSLRVLLQTVLSRSELAAAPVCSPPCPPALPLYPPPVRRFI